jgi:hypothetical protein
VNGDRVCCFADVFDVELGLGPPPKRLRPSSTAAPGGHGKYLHLLLFRLAPLYVHSSPRTSLLLKMLIPLVLSVALFPTQDAPKYKYGYQVLILFGGLAIIGVLLMDFLHKRWGRKEEAQETTPTPSEAWGVLA